MPDPSFVLPLLWQSALLPFAVALTVLLLARRAPLAAVAAGFLASFATVYHAQWSWLPHQSLDWLPWIVLLGSAGVAVTEPAEHAGRRHLARLLLSLGCAALVAWPALARASALAAMLPIAVTGALMFGAWTYLSAAAKQRPTPLLMLAVIAGGAALALMLDASQLIGQLSGALAVALLACLMRGRTAECGAAAGLAVLVLGTLLANAYFYAGVSIGYVLLLASGLLADPLVMAFNRLRQRHGGVGGWVAAGVLSAIPVLATIGLAVRAAQESGGY